MEKHVKRLTDKYSWFEYDPFTGKSRCLACAASAEAKDSKKCMLDEGLLVDSNHIADRLKRHSNEDSHGRAEELWFQHLGKAPKPPVTDMKTTTAAAAMQESLAQARLERRLSCEPLTRAALYLGEQSRPAADTGAVCDMIQ